MSRIFAQTWFEIENVRDKVRELPQALGSALAMTSPEREFTLGRDARVINVREQGNRAGLASDEGQAVLMHHLANIELQAMELAVRSLCEYPDAPAQFRQELAEIAAGEARHLTLCLDAIESVGFEWGRWGVHASLWNAVGPEDSLLDRIAIVHRYLEGAGLDSGARLLRRLQGVNGSASKLAVSTIVREEVDHVAFGSRWYKTICEEMNLDPERDFIVRLEKLMREIPRREPVNRELRARAGFTELEIDAIAAACSSTT